MKYIIRDVESVEHFLSGDCCEIAEVLHPDRIKLPYKGFSVAHAKLHPKKQTLLHKVIKSTELYFIIEGVGRIFIDGHEEPLKKGRFVAVPADTEQYVVNDGDVPLEFLCIVTPEWSAENEKIIGA